MIDLDAVTSDLSGSIFSGKLHHLPVTQSTNIDAMTAGRLGAPHGSVWIADEQTAGRGRSDHEWLSAASEGLYISVLLRLGVPPARLLLLPLAAGLATAEAVRSAAGLEADLRWPNDLLIGPRKAGGILAEAASGFAVVGIGINVHQRSFPDGLATPATSLDLVAGRRVSRQALLVELLKALQFEAEVLSDPVTAAEIPNRVARISSWITGRRVEVHGPQACTGTTAGLDEHGFLRVGTATGLVTVQTGGIRAAAPESSTME
jgi:BirA family biotin operon repressor/biotin-[acetyl-CoA-carboxylase] ligase